MLFKSLQVGTSVNRICERFNLFIYLFIYLFIHLLCHMTWLINQDNTKSQHAIRKPIVNGHHIK